MRRLEPAAITGVMSREVANFRSYWKSTTFSSVLEPVIYLLAFGLGLGSTIVDKVDGLDYVEFVGTGMVATAVIFSSALPAMFGSFVKERFQRTYDAILAAPVDVEELVTAEMLWIGLRSGVYGCFPLIVSMLFGLDPSPGMLLVPLFCFITALGFAGFGIATAAIGLEDRPVQLRDDAGDHAAVPGGGHVLPDRPAARGAAGGWPSSTRSTSSWSWCATPAFGFEATDLLRLAALIVFALALWRVAVARMSKRLID